jgi:hypothetical protein
MCDRGFAVDIKWGAITCGQIGDANVFTIKFVVAVVEVVHGNRSEEGLVSDSYGTTAEVSDLT